MYINGEWLSAKSGGMFDVFNPANGETIAQVPEGGREDAAVAIQAAAESFKTWSGTTAYQRSGYLYDAYRLMMERKEDLARLMTCEQGKPLKSARNEVRQAVLGVKAAVKASANTWRPSWVGFRSADS